MKSRPLVVVVFILLGLLGITAGLVLLGRRETQSKPSTNSYNPSGSLAFRSLLEQNGYHVSVTSSVRPRLSPRDLLVVFDYAVNPEDTFQRVLTRRVPDAKEGIERHLKAGGHVLLLPIEKDFRVATRAAQNSHTAIHPATQQNATPLIVSTSTGVDPRSSVVSYVDLADGPMASLWIDALGTHFSEAFAVGPGRIVAVRDGVFATNRFIDKNQNAEVAMRLVRSLAPDGANLVFDEAGFGTPVEPGMLETIGPWAEAMWFQLIFLFVVIVYTLGKRFGLPQDPRATQLGTRALLDAVADTFRRGRMTSVALQTTVRSTEARLRKAMRLPSDATLKDLHQRLPDNLSRLLSAAATASSGRTKPKDARILIKRLEDEVDLYLGNRAGHDVRPSISLR